MITAEFIEKIALFYHFSMLDEARAQSLTERTIKKLRHEQLAAQMSRRALGSVDLIRITAENLKKSKLQGRPTHLAFSTGELLLPENSNFGPWFEFRKIANEDEFNAVLYSKIMNFSDADIAAALNLPVGTVRFRVSKGLRALGRICQLGGREGES